MDYIELPATNLYGNGYIERYDNTDILERSTLRIVPQEMDKWHIVGDMDMLDALAFRYYGNIDRDASSLWWILADANGIDNPLDISHLAGSFLLVPDYFRIQQLLAVGTTDEDDTVQSNYYLTLDNPPIPLNPPNEEEGQDTTGIQDTQTGSVAQWLVFRKPNGGFVLQTVDADGDPQYSDVNPSTLPNAVIFEAMP